MAGYTSAFRKALLACTDVGPAEALDKYIRGLKPDVRQWVQMSDPSTFAEAAKFADRVFAGSKGKMPRVALQPQQSRPAPTSGPVPMELGALEGGYQRD